MLQDEETQEYTVYLDKGKIEDSERSQINYLKEKVIYLEEHVDKFEIEIKTLREDLLTKLSEKEVLESLIGKVIDENILLKTMINSVSVETSEEND